MLEICCAICVLAPVPTASMAITAPTPITIPSIVSAERILFTLKALKDILNVDGKLIMSFHRLVTDDAAVKKPDDSPAVCGNVRFMGYEDNSDI